MVETNTENTGKEVRRGAGNGKKRRAGTILLIIAIFGLIFGFSLWIRSKTRISTDNAFIEGSIYSISPRVRGNVQQVLVTDNQRVKKGELLVVIEDADFRNATETAAAKLDIARNETSRDYAQINRAKAAVDLARARLEQADLDLKRGEALYRKEVIPREQLDRLSTAEKIAQSQLAEAEEAEQQAKAVVGATGKGSKEARIAERRSELEKAQLDLSYTKMFSPADGYVTRKSVEIGNNVQPGQPLMAVVSLQAPWIIANYKESQLSHVRPGQHVEFEVDAYPGRIFTGTVDSIMAGTGAAFSLLPPENATGNYVKVVQRIPVKIVIDQGADPDHLLRVGMSVVPMIHVDRSIGDVLRDLNPF